MSDDLDFEMEVVENDELHSTGDDSNSEESSHSGKEEADDLDSRTAHSDSREKRGGADRSPRSSGEVDSDPGVFGLSQVPEDWEVSSLPSIVDIEMGSSPPSATYNEEREGLPFYQGNADFGHMRPRVSTWCSDPVKTADRDDVLISIRAPVGDLNIADEHCCIGRGLAALRPSGVNGLYLYYGLAQRSRWLARLASGSTFKSVSSADLEKVDLPVPSLPEQRKIASVLYAVDQAIQKTEEIIEQAKRVRQGLMQDLLQITRKSHDEVDGDWHQLGEVTEWESGSTPSKENDAYWGGTTPWVSAKDMKEVKLNGAEDHLTPEGVDEFGGLAPEGSLLVLVRGMRLKDSFPVCLVKEEVAFNQDVKALTPKDGVDGEFLAYWLKANENRILGLVTSASHGTKRLGTESLKNFRVWIPPEYYQRKTVLIFRAFDQKIQRDRVYRSRLERLKKGLMQDLLTGEVRTADRAIEVLEEVQAHG